MLGPYPQDWSNGTVPSPLPECVSARRFDEYDILGNRAALNLVCACGSWMALEWIDWDLNQYFPVSEERKLTFLSEHNTCTPKCYRCRVTPVERTGYWCQSCEAQA